MTDKRATPPIDLLIARLASRQHGVVSAQQLAELGLSRETISRLVRIGRLHRLHRGVYAVGHTALRWEAAYVAAVMVAGEGAALSHASAAAWWGIRPRPSGNVHITVPTTNGRKRHRHLTIHRSRNLPPHEITTRDGLIVTTVARTLLDYTNTAPRHLADRAVEVAVSRRLVGAEVHDVMRAHPNAPGGATLKALLLEHGDHGNWRQSDFEAYIVDLCRTHGIPLPQTNVPLLGAVVDAYWPDHRVVAEPDGMTWHGTRAAARRDRRNDGDRMANGITTVRVTDEQAQQDGRAVAAAINGAMRR